jgi:PEP-CTERM motif
LENQPETGSVQKVIRRRRTRRHRRNLLYRRILLASFVAVTAFAFSVAALRHFTPSLFHDYRSTQASRDADEASRNLFLQAQQQALRSIEGRAVYPYSVVPGGVKDAAELKWAAEHDPVVASHYAGFDYDHARIVRLVLARTAYVSYRIGNKVYWTRRRITLKKGETLLTDGKITARTRCANRVEEAPEAAFSASEPPAFKFDAPLPMLPAEANPPVPYQSSLMDRPGPPGLGPAPPLGLYEPFGTGNWIPISPPPLPGVCGIGKKGKPGEIEVGGKKKPGNPCGTGGGGGGIVPEPGTWVLFISGLALMGFIARRRFLRTQLDPASIDTSYDRS